MLMGPWALTTAGAATVETAPAAATFKKRRRVEVLFLVGVVMASSPFKPVLGGSAVTVLDGSAVIVGSNSRGSRRFGKISRCDATLRCAPQTPAATPSRARAPGNGGAVNSRAAARSRSDRQHLAGGAVRRIFPPAHRSARPFQHAAHAHRVGPEMKIHGALMQRALRLRGAIALAQIIEPGRAMIALGP